MPIHTSADALAYLQTHLTDKSPVRIREGLTHPESEFLAWVKQESQELRAIVEKTLDHVLTDPSPRQRFQEFYDVFLALEQQGNDLSDTHDCGTALSRHILSAPLAHQHVKPPARPLSPATLRGIRTSDLAHAEDPTKRIAVIAATPLRTSIESSFSKN